jgi:hypothetical protein
LAKLAQNVRGTVHPHGRLHNQRQLHADSTGTLLEQVGLLNMAS